MVVTLIVFLAAFVCVHPWAEIASAAGPTYVGGRITESTTWTIENSPYIVATNVTVNIGVTLTIESGVIVKFNRSDALFIEGGLIALGEADNPITFTSNLIPQLVGDWSVIKFNDSSDDLRSVIKYSRIEYAYYGIMCEDSSPLLSNNIIDKTYKKGIYLERSNSTIIDNTITNVSDKAIDIVQSSPLITNNLILNNNYYGIKSYLSSPTIVNNSISVTVEGIYLWQSPSVVSNNTIASTGDGIYLDGSEGTLIFDNHLEGNNYGLYLVASNSTIVCNTTIRDGNFGIYAFSSSLTTVNSTIENSNNKDFFLAGNSHITTVNSTFDDTKLMISSDSTLVVKNHLAVAVRNKDNSPILVASVDVRDDDVTIYSLQIDDDGLLEWMTTIDREYIGSNTATEHMTTVDVSYNGLVFVNNPRNVDMSTSHTEIFKVKNILPVLDIISPAMNETVWGTKSIAGVANDLDGQIIAVELKIGSNNWLPLSVFPASFVDWDYEWNTRTVANGTVYVFVRTVDSDGEWNTASTFVRVDNYGPIVEVISHSDHDIVRSLVEIIGETSDERGNVTSVMVSIDDDPWVMATMQEANWSRWAYTFDTRELTNGEHVISILALDDQPTNGTITLILYVDNLEPEPQVVDWFFWAIVLTIIAIVVLALIVTLRRWRSRTKGKKEDEAETEISSEERIEKLRKAYEDGLISEEVYKLNLAKLNIKDSESSKSLADKEEFSFVCPTCNEEVEPSAKKCNNCGTVFKD